MSREVAIAPRLLTRQQAAAYCGVSVPTFDARCPVQAIAMGHGKRMERFDVQALDAWIIGMGGAGTATPAKVDWAALL